MNNNLIKYSLNIGYVVFYCYLFVGIHIFHTYYIVCLYTYIYICLNLGILFVCDIT